MRNSLAIGSIAGLVTAAALGGLVVSTGKWPPHLDAAPHEAAGCLLAQEALRRLADGGRLTVITRDTSDFQQPAIDLLLSSFRRTVERAGATVAALHALEVDPLRPIEVPSGDFMEWIGKAQVGSVIVSFLGPPLLTSEQRLQLGQIRPSIVAFCPGNLPAQIDLRQVFAQGVLDAAVVSRRRSPTTAPAEPETGRAELFRTITATNVSALYATSAGQRWNP
jgi:hypothetical protein